MRSNVSDGFPGGVGVRNFHILQVGSEKSETVFDFFAINSLALGFWLFIADDGCPGFAGTTQFYLSKGSNPFSINVGFPLFFLFRMGSLENQKKRFRDCSQLWIGGSSPFCRSVLFHHYLRFER